MITRHVNPINLRIVILQTSLETTPWDMQEC